MVVWEWLWGVREDFQPHRIVGYVCHREEWLNADIKPWERVLIKRSHIARAG